jgi:hypothetical protein
MEKNILLASFILLHDIDESLKKLKNKNIVSNKVFVLKNSNDENKIILTYNILSKNDEVIDFNKYIRGTISLHRKKDTNTLYTLNALNEIVKMENNDKTDENFIINWNLYKNCILISKDGQLLRINTLLDSIKDLAKL